MNDTIEIRIPANRPDALAAFGRALLEIAAADPMAETIDIDEPIPLAPTVREMVDAVSSATGLTPEELTAPTHATDVEAEAHADASADDDLPTWAEPDPARLDSAGFPWDERVHSSTKSVLKDGTWKARRGVDPAVLATVRAERFAAPAPAPVPEPLELEAPAPAAEMSFPDFMQFIAAEGYDNVTKMNDLAAVAEMNSIAMVATRPDLIPVLVAHVEAARK